VAQSDAWRSYLDRPAIAVSADARYIAFASYAPLVPADTNGRADIYVLDRVNGSVGLESLTPDGRVSALGSTQPGISGDGQFVVYETSGPIWAASPLRANVLLRNRRTSTVTPVGAPVMSGSADDRSHSPVISADGRFVAFVSSANPTWSPDANRTGEDIYVFDVRTGVTRRVSVNETGAQAAEGSSVSPSISADGRVVAFTSSAPLHHAAANAGIRAIAPGRPATHIYVRDLELNTTRLVSVTSGRVAANGSSWTPSIDASGRYLAFVSIATNLASGDRNGVADVFVADLQSGLVELVSGSAKGGSPNGPSGNPALSADGRLVAFQSDASNLVCASDCPHMAEDINLLWDVFLFDRESRTTTRVSADAAGGWMEGSAGPAIDAAGAIVAFSSRHPTDPLDTKNDFDLFIRATGDARRSGHGASSGVRPPGKFAR
jgi:Tol biopolymer transport system component